MKIALVYDRVNKWGGAERVLLALQRIFKNAPLYTSLYNRENAGWADKFDVRPSFLQKIPKASNSHEFLAMFMPIAFESFSFDEYDAVISVSSESAKGIITKPNTFHMAICLTPTRYLWSGYDEYFTDKTIKFISKPLVSYLRIWDRGAALRPDHIISISETVKKRVKNYYKRDSSIIYPPLHLVIDRKINGREKNTGNYYLLVSRLVPYKKVDIAIHACNELRLPLKIIGVGRELEHLKSLAGPTIEFVGRVSDRELVSYYRRAKALIFPGNEDFGLVMVEAQAAGIPVIAYKAGGAREIVVENKTGTFFKEQNKESLRQLLENFDAKQYNSYDCILNSQRFLHSNFEKQFKKLFNDKISQYFGLSKRTKLV
jgi:glycosyltransferase involved in cell wall biosynthesis